MVSYINTFIFIFFRTFSTPGFFPRMIPSFIVGSWFCSTGVDAATLEWSPGACPKKRIPGSTRNHTFSFQNPGFWMVQNSQSQQCRGLWNHAENRQLSKSTQKRKHWNWRIKIHSLPMKHPFSNQPAWLRNWEKNGHVFSRRAPPQPGSAVPSAVSEDEGLAGKERNEPTQPEGSLKRDPAHHQTQLGFPTRLIHSSPDPTKMRKIFLEVKSPHFLWVKSQGLRPEPSIKTAPKKHMKWCFTTNPGKGTSANSRQVSYSKGWVSHGYQCNVHGQFLRQSVTSRTSMDSISGPGFCTIKYPAYRP